MKVKKFYEPVYRFELLFYTDCTFEEADKKFRRNYKIRIPVPDMSGNTGCTLVLNGKSFPTIIKSGTVAFIWIGDKKDFYCLMHEVTHLIIDIFNVKGLEITTDKSSHEAFAYYFEYWFRTLWRFMNKK